MDDFLDSSTQRGTGAARPVAGTPESAWPAVLGASRPRVLAGADDALGPTLRFPAGAQEASRAVAPPSPRSAHDNADRLAAGKPRRLPRTRPKRSAASRCRPWLWNAASILSLAVALVCLALIPPFGGKSAVHPELTDVERWAAGDGLHPEVNPDGWRLISMRLQKDDGGYVDIELLRPVEWIERHQVEVGVKVDVELTELGGAGWADVFNIRACPPIGPPPGAGFRVVTGRYAHSAGDTFDLRVTKVSNSPGRNETWVHPDGSEVRIHPYGNLKQAPLGNQLNDRGFPSTNPADTHIGMPNPRDFPTVRGRPHGASA